MPSRSIIGQVRLQNKESYSRIALHERRITSNPNPRREGRYALYTCRIRDARRENSRHDPRANAYQAEEKANCKQEETANMMSRRTIRVTAILLALVASLVALLGYDFVSERQRMPPVYRRTWIDV